MLLSTLTWPEVEAYLQRSDAVIVPIGSTEQHGPTGLIGTDAICAEAIAQAVGARSDTLVAPVFSVGAAEHHMGFPGTITLRPETMAAALEDWVGSLCRHGFRRFFFINGHGGNVPAMREAFRRFAEAGIGGVHPQCVFQNWWMVGPVEKLRKALFGDADGGHATASEISLTYYLYPETVRRRVLEPQIAPTGPIKSAADYRKRFPDGRIGSDPSLARPDHGRRLFDAACEGLTQELRHFLAGS